MPPQFDRVQFLARPDVSGATLSPDGRHVAYLREEGRNRGVWLLPTAGGAPRRLLSQTDAARLSWSRDSRWLFLASPRQLFALATAGQAGSGAIAKLGGRWEREFETADPASPAAAIVLESPPLVSRLSKRWRLYRIGVDGKQTLLHEDARQIVGFAFDDRAKLAFVSVAESDKYVVYRIVGGRRREAMRCVNLERCSLLSAGNDGSALLETNVGSDRVRLARLDPGGRLQTLQDDPRGEADIDEVALDPLTRQPLIASYRSTVAANFGLTPDASRHVEAIEKRCPQRNLRIEVGRGAGARWLVHERAGSLKGERLHLYDPVSGDFREILGDAGFHHGRTPTSRLPETQMARKIAFAYPGSDGMRLQGFVLLPPGVDPARAPLVANVHGGPFNLYRPEFSAQSQLLANRGYVVFEPNFRGSTGLGREYMFAGKGDFGNGRVQQDIVDGVRYLLAQGIGDAGRVGMIGASFGGYSALQGVTFQPELFKVGVAAVPPADFGWVLRWYSRSVDRVSPGIPLSTSMRLLSLDPADAAIAERLRAQSPIANAPRMNRPVLLLAGGDDERVPIRSVLHYAAELKTLGKDVSLFVDAEGEHQLVDPLTREAYLYLLERILHRRLGGVEPKRPDKALRQHLRRNLLLAGSDFRDLQ
ncbi:prolyl oligopeptidase family serine peptidase [Luteimonas sp. SX5]|uniref:Prolyl oligopeptidase family serine peptidase n=1 Tax=Luteimonas galliterrae TaxID=2940486 RepID=A0ABT0MFY8_9GAMM|nr:alpha/beta fold hydrolase [Luteimonas galliterrae]MCL1633797.1 prolyl oligopeptidase family serine peptidase [Luteimonas galliterrae]